MPIAEGNELATLLGPFWSDEEVMTRLGLQGLAELRALCEAGGVLALRTSDDVDVYPVWQFHRRVDRVELRPELSRLLGPLRGFDPWSVGVLLMTPAPELDHLTPLEWAKQGRDEATLAAFGRRIAAEWSR